MDDSTSQRWAGARALLERASRSLAGGVSSPFRTQFSVPLYFREGFGAHLTDTDGNEYMDYVLGWGPAILGHAHPEMVQALRHAVERPHIYGQQHEMEIHVAERIQTMVPCAERVAFTGSGSEAVQLAHRLARAFTNRELILKFEGHYHGWMDSALIGYRPAGDQLGDPEYPPSTLGSRGQVSNCVENSVVAPWNRLDTLERIMERHAGRVAAVVMEPVMCNGGCLLPSPGYLPAVRDLAHRHGALLIFDEVITGFRISPGGAQKYYDVLPDLATFGKAVGGGLPLSVVAGRHEILEQMFSGGVKFGGTFNGNPISLTGADTALGILARDDGAVLKQVNALGRVLMEGLQAEAQRRGISLRVTGFGAALALHFGNPGRLLDYRDTLSDDRDMLRRFLSAALAEGLHLVPDGRMYVSAAHTQRDIEETIAAASRAMETACLL